MEHDVCNIVYLDRRASEARIWTKNQPPTRTSPIQTQGGHSPPSPVPMSPAQEVNETIHSLLTLFPRVSVHRNSPSCLAEIRSTYENGTEVNCTILLIDIPSEDESSHHPPSRLVRTPSPTSGDGMEFGFFTKADMYGMNFLVHVSSEIQSRIMTPLVLPVALLSGSSEQSGGPDQSLNPFTGSERMRAQRFAAKEPISKMRYFDAGAADILTSPASPDRIRGLPAHAHWIKHESKRRRSSRFLPSGHSKKTSWVGTKEDKPYTQLKEAMVSELMSRICDPDYEESPVDDRIPPVDPGRHDYIAGSFGDWSFSAHEFSDDELLYGVFLMLEHTLKLPGLEKWRLEKDDLLGFLMAARRVYNSSVLYHNFRHACDVTQAAFCFLTKIGVIPSFPSGETVPTESRSAMSNLLNPFDALVLLISAIGHDVGHPGVNNGFLVNVNAPLAQLYNDRSVLESFHCAAYSQILRRYWKSTFCDATVRRLMINSILATDMGLHKDYVTQMETLQTTFTENGNVETWSIKTKDETRELLLCLLIKCADICNVARKFNVAWQWATIIIDEFYAQGQIERDLNVPSALFGGPPDPSSLHQKCQSQIGFSNVFAQPLFVGVTKLLPAMQFIVDEIALNTGLWQSQIASEAEKRDEAKEKAEQKATDDDRADEDNSTTRSEESETIQRLPSADFHTHPSGRRVSGGAVAHFAGLPKPSEGARRASLGPTVDPDLSARHASASRNDRSGNWFRYVLCCGSSTLKAEPRVSDHAPATTPSKTKSFDASTEEMIEYRR